MVGVTDQRVLLAEPRGYCAGVDRAVVAVERALEHFDETVYVRHEIVHNKFVVDSLRERGAVFVEEVDEIPEGSLVIFSAHGISPAVREAAEERGLRTIDATCPLVTKVHKEAVRFAKAGYDILLVGHAGHEEVEGTAGEAPDHVQIVDSRDDLDAIQVRDPDKVVWLSQTTLSVDETMETVERLRERFPNLQSPPSDDICYATQNRQVAVKKIAPDSDLVLVVGSANSSNSVRLMEVAKENGAKDAHRIDFISELKDEWFEGVTTVGVTSGASVPEVLVQALLKELAERGYGTVERVRTAQEDLMFSLPRELRQEMKAQGADDRRERPQRDMRDAADQSPLSGRGAAPTGADAQ
ncbi:4-hydroxy-3-methylbut-2-enyl diphosphate reductase [Helcobacillus massiliensis]|uniref:4-hydroxy-3-methylbut-2-enyl diphosphate reductase n=1 Tax=Helcobacillus massiliensis TaxID=521392 RepID=UPI00160B905B|nr:4-hydroxy-3-methylbut-2-enyl diphosphate reductase [Helcobacillus massiliensis]MCT1558156.1 4-hydroxy-3-methylbut-2-enyl diphosphate reductase [Helcobacillus massiliensis]MCT2036489.1 4-hydroxy-3-methylbut-2-enyl diphosphate reductase [Helcobacillus massiliensis]MCT2332293.1 4-hydroxy-3-methylbut-2-enyl diphosphate reductase [Helcobacillus massiliensis]